VKRVSNGFYVLHCILSVRTSNISRRSLPYRAADTRRRRSSVASLIGSAGADASPASQRQGAGPDSLVSTRPNFGFSLIHVGRVVVLNLQQTLYTASAAHDDWTGNAHVRPYDAPPTAAPAVRERVAPGRGSSSWPVLQLSPSPSDPESIRDPKARRFL
jgi:hypothetical protein